MIYKYMYLLNFTQVTHKPPIHAYIILPFVMISSTKTTRGFLYQAGAKIFLICIPDTTNKSII